LFDIVTDIPQPKDKSILLRDIIYTQGENKYLNENQINRGVLKNQAQIYHTGISMGFVNFPTNINGKSKALLTFNILGSRELNHIEDNKGIRILNKVEMCRLQGFPDDYCNILTNAKAGSLLGDGWTLPVIEWIFSFIVLDFNI
jgi:site-specific DNA-cytosine methylase